MIMNLELIDTTETESTKPDDNLSNEFKPSETKSVKKTRTANSTTIKKKANAHEPTEEKNLNYENYIKYNILLIKYKLPQLKAAAKLYKLAITGTKPVLVERLEKQFKKITAAHIAQRHFRGWIVRKSIKLRGPALRNKSMCNNDKDFVTLEPLIEIPTEYFYSYTDNKKFTYGFNIMSLIQTLKTKGSLMNPYNREKMPHETTNEIISLYKITRIIDTEFKKDNENLIIYSNNNNARNHQPVPLRHPAREQSVEISSILTGNYRPMLNRNSINEHEDLERYNKIRGIRSMPVNQRINNIFVEFDQLGNYTNVEWFSSLNIRDYIRLYRGLYDIWNYRNLTRELRARLCPFHDPFDGIFPRPVQHSELTFLQIQMACLIVLENLVYSGADEDTRKIGAFHALSGLTTVSIGARTAMPWLYDSVVF
jgi:hypothetical protein